MPNLIKIAAYLGYWFVRRKPVQILGDLDYIKLKPEASKGSKIEISQKLEKIKADLQFANESIAVRFMMATFLDFSKEDICTESQKKDWNAAIAYAKYFLAYRAESPKSVEAMLASITVIPRKPPKQDFWQKIKNEDE